MLRGRELEAGRVIMAEAAIDPAAASHLLKPAKFLVHLLTAAMGYRAHRRPAGKPANFAPVEHRDKPGHGDRIPRECSPARRDRSIDRA
ncbi:hypothetical protein [Mycobacterium sp.]|uniref:hypothetical protein n=1 Tax=Mycobacterium sp. TaxID=1785 RepID=UPI003D09AFC4